MWRVQHLDAGRVADVLAAADRCGVLEVVLSGGEPTLHPQFDAVLGATRTVSRAAVVLVTNATRVDEPTAEQIGTANLARVCVSLDGVDPTIHASARGDNHDRVVAGLRRIRATGVPVTVISVVHQGNFRQIGELSDWLLAEGLADQHHLCSPSYSGEAKENYAGLRLGEDDYLTVQTQVDARHVELAERGLFTTFNSFWPATGRRSPVVDAGRTITLQQLVEQVKDLLLHVRPTGEVRLAAASWGRETVGNAMVGSLGEAGADELLLAAERRYLDGSLGQLPREVEASHKFQLGLADWRLTDLLLDDHATPADQLASLVPLRPISHLSLLDNPLTPAELARVAGRVRAASAGGVRFLRHPCGIGLVYDRERSHVTLLRDGEWPRLVESLEAGS